MRDKEKLLDKLKEAVNNNNRKDFYSCVEKLETSEYEYAFTNMHRYDDSNFWSDWKNKILNVKNTIRLDRNQNSAYVDADIFLYMYPMVVVETFFCIRQDEAMLKKAYNDLVRRLEDGLDLLCSSMNIAQAAENREKQKIYYERFGHSVIRNYENNVELKFNLLSYVYALAQYYQVDPDDKRCLKTDVIEKCLITPVYDAFKNDNKFQEILERQDDESNSYWENYRLALADYKTLLRGTQIQTEKQTGAEPEEMPEKPTEKLPATKKGNMRDESIMGKVLPTMFSRFLALMCVALLISNTVLFFRRTPSPDGNNHGAGDALVESEKDNTTSSAISHEGVSVESQNVPPSSSIAHHAESGTDYSGDSGTPQSSGESSFTNDVALAAGRELFLSENRYLRATPKGDNNQNIILMIQSEERVRILKELDESWLYVEYIMSANEDGTPYEYGYQGYIKRLENDKEIV